MVRHPLDHRLRVGRSAADRRDLTGRHPRRRVGAHRAADPECAARVRPRAGRPCHRCRDRGRLEGGPTGAGRVAVAGLAARRVTRRGCRGARAGGALRRGRGRIDGGALVDDARPLRGDRLRVRPVQPDGAVGVVRAQRDRRNVGGRRRVQRPRGVGHVQFVHRVRWRHSGATGAGRGPDAAARPGVGGAADRRGGFRCRGRSAVRAAATAVAAGPWQADRRRRCRRGDDGAARLRGRGSAGQLRRRGCRPGHLRAGCLPLVRRHRRPDRGDDGRDRPASPPGSRTRTRTRARTRTGTRGRAGTPNPSRNPRASPRTNHRPPRRTCPPTRTWPPLCRRTPTWTPRTTSSWTTTPRPTTTGGDTRGTAD